MKAEQKDLMMVHLLAVNSVVQIDLMTIELHWERNLAVWMEAVGLDDSIVIDCELGCADERESVANATTIPTATAKVKTAASNLRLLGKVRLPASSSSLSTGAAAVSIAGSSTELRL